MTAAEETTPFSAALASPRDAALVAIQLALLPVAAFVPSRHWPGLARAATAPLCHVATPAMRERRARMTERLSGHHGLPSAEEIDREALARRMVQMLQYLKLHLPGGWNPAARLRGGEHVERALDGGRGAILWVAPQIDASLGVKLAFQGAGHPLHHVSSVYHGLSHTRLGQRFLNRIQIDAERRLVAERIVKDGGVELGPMRAVTRSLRENGVVSIHAVPFGGRMLKRKMLSGQMSFSAGPASLARLSGAPLLPVFSGSPEHGAIEVTVEAPLEAPEGLREREATEALVTGYAARVEAATLRDPAGSLIWHYPS